MDHRERYVCGAPPFCNTVMHTHIIFLFLILYVRTQRKNNRKKDVVECICNTVASLFIAFIYYYFHLCVWHKKQKLYFNFLAYRIGLCLRILPRYGLNSTEKFVSITLQLVHSTHTHNSIDFPFLFWKFLASTH